MPVVAIGACSIGRLFFLRYGHPEIFYADEDDVVEAAIGTLTGDSNPHLFKYPHLVIHILAVCLRLLYSADAPEGMDLAAHALASYARDPQPAVLVARVVVLGLSLIAIPATALLASLFWGRGTALVAAALLCLSPLHMDVTRVARVDGPMTAFSVLAMYLAVRHGRHATWRNLFGAALATGAAAGSKYYGGLVALPCLYFVWTARARAADRARRCALFCLTAIAFFVLTSPHIVLAFPEFLAAYRWIAPFYSVPYWGVAGEATLSAWFVPILRSGIGPVGVLGVIALIGSRFVRRADARLDVFIATLGFPIALVLFFINSETFFPRFFVGAVPFVCAAAAGGMTEILRRKPANRGRASRIAFGTLLFLAALPHLRDSIETATRLALARDTRLLARSWIDRNLPGDTPLLLGPRGQSPYFPCREYPLPHEAESLRRYVHLYAPRYLPVLDDARSEAIRSLPPQARQVRYAKDLTEADVSAVSSDVALVVPHHRMKSFRVSGREAALAELPKNHAVAARFEASWMESFGPPVEIWLSRSFPLRRRRAMRYNARRPSTHHPSGSGRNRHGSNDRTFFACRRPDPTPGPGGCNG